MDNVFFAISYMPATLRCQVQLTLATVKVVICVWPKAGVRGIIRVDDNGETNNRSRHDL